MKFLNWKIIYKIFIYEWNKKLIALIIAILMWIYVSSLYNVEHIFYMPIQFVNLPNDLIVIDSSDYTATLVVKGEKEKIKNIDISKYLNVKVDLSKAKIGINEYPIEIDKNEKRLDFYYELNKNKITLTIDYLTNKILPVNIIIKGQPANGYYISDYIIGNDFAIVKGPKKLIDEITNLEPIPIDISRATSNINLQIKFKLPKLVTIENQDELFVDIIINKISNQ